MLHTLPHIHVHQAGDGGSESLSHLVSLFVERSAALWKGADVQAWLRAAAEAAADVADGLRGGAAPTPVPAGTRPQWPPRPDAIEVQGSASDWSAVAAEAFPPGSNDYRHLRLADFAEAAPALPADEVRAALAARDDAMQVRQ